MRALLAPAAALLALAGPVALTPQASAESTTLKAVIFEEVKPLYQKTDAGYEGLGVDVLEQIRIQAKRRKVDYRVAKSVNDGIGAVITGKADIACGVAFTWGRSTQVTYSLPFGIGGTRLLMAKRHHRRWNPRLTGGPNHWCGEGHRFRPGAEERGARRHAEELHHPQGSVGRFYHR